MFPGGYDYRSVEVNGTEYTDVAVPLIYMAAGLQLALYCIDALKVLICSHVSVFVSRKLRERFSVMYSMCIL